MFNKYPYTDFHELNLDWIIEQIKQLHNDYDEFKAVNTITNAGAWDITKQYQSWTIVSYGTAGYISLKPVPSGIAITNIEYWGLVADYDILITNLSNRVSILEADDVVLNNRVGSLEGDNTSNISRITTLEKNLDPLLNRKFLFIGDSYSVYNNPTFIDTVRDSLGLTDNVNLFRSVNSGYGFSNASGKFITLLNNAVIPAGTVITDIIVLGGTNDAFVLSDIETDIEAFMTDAKALHPKATVHIGCLAGNRTIAIKDAIPNVVIEYQKCAKYGAAYITNCEYIMSDQRLIGSDDTHPTQAGSDYIGMNISNYILNGSLDIIASDIFTPPGTGIMNSNIKWSMANGTEYIEFHDLHNLPLNAVYTNQYNYMLNITTYPFNGNGSRIWSGVCLFESNGNTYVRPMMIRCTAQYMEYYVQDTIATTYTNVSDVYFTAVVTADKLKL